MPLLIKIILTAIFIIIGGSVWLVKPENTNNPGPAWMWRGQSFTKNLLFRNDGTLRSYTRTLFCLCFIAMILIIWTAA